MDTIYSQKFKEIINDSRNQAVRHNSANVMPEHLMLSLLSDPASSSYNLVERASKGATPRDLGEQLDKVLFDAALAKGYRGNVAISDVTMSDITGRIIKLSVLEARMLKSNEVDAAHLLLAIFNNSEARNS